MIARYSAALCIALGRITEYLDETDSVVLPIDDLNVSHLIDRSQYRDDEWEWIMFLCSLFLPAD